MTDCLFCDAKDVTSEHRAKCHTDLVRALATDLLLFGIRAAEKIINENGSLIGVRHVNPMRLSYDRETESYRVEPRSLQPLTTAGGTILTTRSRYHQQKVSMNEREASVRKAASGERKGLRDKTSKQRIETNRRGMVEARRKAAGWRLLVEPGSMDRLETEEADERENQAKWFCHGHKLGKAVWTEAAMLLAKSFSCERVSAGICDGRDPREGAGIVMSREKGEVETMLTSDMEEAERRRFEALTKVDEEYLRTAFSRPTLEGVPFPRFIAIGTPNQGGSKMYERYLAMDKSPERTEIVPLKGVL